MEQLADVAQLRTLDLRGSSQLSNSGLQHLQTLKNLKALRIGGYQSTTTPWPSSENAQR